MSSNNPNRVYLDTETTGLHPEEGDEILSLTIVDANGRLLFDERFKPKHKKEWPEAQAVNHISPEDVEHLTTIDAYMEQICRILDHIADEIVGYNVAFDLGFLKAAGAAINPDAVMIESGSEGLPKDCWDLNPQGRPFAVTEPILHRLQSSAKLCARAGTTTQFTRMTVNQWFDKAERSRRSPLGRSVDIGRAASALNSQHEHAEVPQHLSK